MGYYMSELYRRYFRATGFSELEEEIENTRQEVRDCLDQAQQRKLMHLRAVESGAGPVQLRGWVPAGHRAAPGTGG